MELSEPRFATGHGSRPGMEGIMAKHGSLLLRAVLLAALAAPAGGAALAQDSSSQSLIGPVEGMGEQRKIMPLPKMQVDPSTASPDATPAERPLRPFSGWVGPRGCGFVYDGLFLGRLQDGRISGMAGEGVNFDWPIAHDGRFGGRLPLKKLDTGAQVFQWIEGRVDGDRLVIDVEYGVIGEPDTFCSGSDIVLPVG